MTTLAATIRNPVAWVLSEERRLDLCLVLTLLLLLLYPLNYWYVKIPLSVIVISAFIFPSLRTSRILWAVVTLIVAAGTYGSWYSADNHKYLLGYWCLAIFVALMTADAERCLAKSARWMIALVFVISVAQKSLSSDYLDGTFFYYALLLDERFSGLAKYVGGIPDFFHLMNHAARQALVSYDSTLTMVQLQGTESAAGLGLFIAWWNYLIQIVLGAVFLLPCFMWLSRSRDVLLLVFLFSTYLFAPVIGFGWVLAIMGIAQTDGHQTTTRVLYVVSFLVLQIYRTPWGELFSLI